MEFFDNTWLNEGLTKFMENYISKNFGNGFLKDLLRYSYFYPMTFESHALNNKLLKSEKSIRNKFDTFTYEKGGYIMYMLISIFGEEKVFNGLKLLLQ